MKIYVTKYCLSAGIQEYDAEIKGSMAVPNGEGHLLPFHGEGKDWHRTKQDAVDRAEEVRIKKLQSLDKQAKKIANLIFDI